MIKNIVFVTTFLVAFLILVGCGSSGGDSTPQVDYHPYDAPTISASLKNEYLGAVNNARATGRTCGGFGFFPSAPALSWHDGLYGAAYEHSEDISVAGTSDGHTGSGGASDWTSQILELGRGSTPSERIRNNGVVSDSTRENAANGFSSTGSVMKGWLASPSHCASIMGGSGGSFGMARVGSSWTQTFSE